MTKLTRRSTVALPLANSTIASIKEYYRLTKPGIIRGNIMTAAAGYLLASEGDVDFWTLLATLVGIALIIAGACVLNNYIDRDIDSRMERTKKRALVTGAISTSNAIIYACGLEIVGFWVLASYTNAITVIIGTIGMFSYVVLYGYFKRASVHGTLIGSISGATSLVAGYCAVTGRFDRLALLLFIIMASWQMPHFFAIGIYRLKDYKEANLPILPAKRGIAVTKRQIIIYIVIFMIAASLLTVFNYTGYTYLIIMMTLGALWLRLAVKGVEAKDDIKWGKQIFGFSLLTLLAFSLLIAIDNFLP